MKPSLPRHGQTDAKALRAASRWQVRHEAGLTPDEQAEFEAWLAGSPRHALAWSRMAATAQTLERLNRDGVATMQVLRELTRRRQRRKWKVLTGGALAVIVASAAVWFMVFRLPVPLPAPSPQPERVMAEVPKKPASGILRKAERRLLEDGSRVDLNTDAHIQVTYTADRREVTLLSGEALFRVEKDPRRPFVVRSGSVEVRAVGTAFSVQRTGEDANVLVTEGQVAVTRAEIGAGAAGSPTAPVLVGAGNLLAISATDKTAAPQAVSGGSINRRLAWTRPRLLLDETALADAVATLNDENDTHILIDDPALSRLRLTGTFFADDPSGFVRLLESNYHVAVERRQDGAVILRGR